jgi:hypothetical protein
MGLFYITPNNLRRIYADNYKKMGMGGRVGAADSDRSKFWASQGGH